MFWWIFFGGVTILVFLLLFAPIKVGLSSIQNKYFVAYGGVFEASATLTSEDINLNFKLLGIGKKASLLHILAGNESDDSIQEWMGKLFFGESKNKIPVHVLWGILKSFKVKKLYSNIDFGSVYYNAWLFPLGEIFKQKNIHCTTNFEGRFQFELLITNRLAYIFWSVLKSHVKHKKND